MKIDGAGRKGIQKAEQVKSAKPATPQEVKDIKAPIPAAPVKPKGETSVVGELGTAARSIAGEDLADNRAGLSRPISQAVDIVMEQREAS